MLYSPYVLSGHATTFYLAVRYPSTHTSTVSRTAAADLGGYFPNPPCVRQLPESSLFVDFRKPCCVSESNEDSWVIWTAKFDGPRQKQRESSRTGMRFDQSAWGWLFPSAREGSEKSDRCYHQLRRLPARRLMPYSDCDTSGYNIV